MKKQTFDQFIRVVHLKVRESFLQNFCFAHFCQQRENRGKQTNIFIISICHFLISSE